MAWTEANWKAQVLRDLGDRGSNAAFELVFPSEATAGTWDFTFAGASADAIARFLTAAVLEDVMETVETIGTGNVSVSLGQRGYAVTFKGGLGGSAQPYPEIDGTNLSGTGLEVPVVVAVRESNPGAAPFLADSLNDLWEKWDSVENMETRYKIVRYDAAVELRGILIYQINQATGDVKREYAKQFDHLQSLMPEFASAYSANVPASGDGSLTTNGTSVSQLISVTPNGLPYGQMGLCGGRFQ